MKKYYSLLMLLGLSIGFASYTQGQSRVEDFQTLMNHLNTGKAARAVFDYAKCDLKIDGKDSDYKPQAIGGMSIDVYEYFAKGAVRNDRAYVVFSENKLIENPIGEGYVYNYAKVRVYEDGEVIIYVRYLDPMDYSVKMDESFRTSIKTATNDAGASFFVDL